MSTPRRRRVLKQRYATVHAPLRFAICRLMLIYGRRRQTTDQKMRAFTPRYAPRHAATLMLQHAAPVMKSVVTTKSLLRAQHEHDAAILFIVCMAARSGAQRRDEFHRHLISPRRYVFSLPRCIFDFYVITMMPLPPCLALPPYGRYFTATLRRARSYATRCRRYAHCRCCYGACCFAEIRRYAFDADIIFLLYYVLCYALRCRYCLPPDAAYAAIACRGYDFAARFAVAICRYYRAQENIEAPFCRHIELRAACVSRYTFD